MIRPPGKDPETQPASIPPIGPQPRPSLEKSRPNYKRIGFSRSAGSVLVGDHLTDMGAHHLLHRQDVLRTLVVEEVRVGVLAVRHHCGVEFISGLSLADPVAALTCQFNFLAPS